MPIVHPPFSLASSNTDDAVDSNAVFVAKVVSKALINFTGLSVLIDDFSATNVVGAAF